MTGFYITIYKEDLVKTLKKTSDYAKSVGEEYAFVFDSDKAPIEIESDFKGIRCEAGFDGMQAVFFLDGESITADILLKIIGENQNLLTDEVVEEILRIKFFLDKPEEVKKKKS
jgi:hypothetical protein